MRPARWVIVWGICAPVCAARGQTLSFVDVSTSAGLSYGGVGAARTAVAIGDYNNDGWPDVCLTGSTVHKTRLFRNNGDGTFTNVTATALPADIPNAGAAAFADLDNDGDVELLLVRAYNSLDDVGLTYYDNSGGVFSDAVPPGPLGRYAGKVGGMAVGDVDGDGDLDVVFTHNNGPGYCFLNAGDGALVDATSLFGGLGIYHLYWTVILADFNEDLRLDLHVSVDEMSRPDLHLLQQPDGSFVNSAGPCGLSQGGNHMGIALGDIDNDGDLDFYTTNIGQQLLFVNTGFGVFQEQAAARGVAYSDVGGFAVIAWGTVFADLDNDGDQDLAFVSSGGRGAIFRNDGTGHFTGVSAGCGIDMFETALAKFDYDRDGDLDLIMTRSDGKVVLCANVSPDGGNNHWLAVKLRGRDSNADGIGARVSVTAGGLKQTQQMLGSESYVTAPLSEVHFGLGSASTAEAVVVDWPSGRESIRANVAGDQVLRIVEAPAGDLNCDGQVNLFDIDPFVQAIEAAGDGTPFVDYYGVHPDCDVWLADLDLNGSIDWLDVDPFVRLLTGR